MVLIHCVNKPSFSSRVKNNFHSMSRPHVHHDTIHDNDRCLYDNEDCYHEDKSPETYFKYLPSMNALLTAWMALEASSTRW